MEGDGTPDAALGSFPLHHHVAAPPSHPNETETLQGSDRLRP